MNKDQAEAQCARYPVWVKTYGADKDPVRLRKQEWIVQFLPMENEYALVEHVTTVRRDNKEGHSVCKLMVT